MKRFLYFLSLRTGTELIILTLLLNKISGFYGLLAILTGLHLSSLQLSMYVYSLFALALAGYLTPHLRRQSPIHVLGLAWFYVIDTVVNAVYTAAFAINWFLVIGQHHPTAVRFGHTILEPENVTSISIILMLWGLRIYFILVIMSYARSVLRQHVYSTSSSTGLYRRENPSDPDSGTSIENPFATNREDGKGWEGRLGRAMIALVRSYWLGVDEDDGWARGMGGKFRRSGEAPVTFGPMERERRRRSGTGPLPPPTSNPAGIPWATQGTK
ncbi:hypothetical protein FGG08_000180 [Glutinoglossum americanum]|uniref:DUF1753-domain-containing protein n=1 Tax=Glutinoglossum americanum TaxID=1670608 RepID=A0A9P8IGV9_9PEZI|nr:hypothetical protein FGG08_000180 [Glutinoglossum americanum]